MTEAGDGSTEQRSENKPKRCQRNSNCKMQFRKEKPCAKGKAKVNNVYAKKSEENFITEENLHQRVQTQQQLHREKNILLGEMLKYIKKPHRTAVRTHTVWKICSDRISLITS